MTEPLPAGGGDLAAVADAYRRQGYVACEGLLSADEIEALRRETVAIVRGERGEIVGRSAADGRSDDALMAEVIATVPTPAHAARRINSRRETLERLILLIIIFG